MTIDFSNPNIQQFIHNPTSYLRGEGDLLTRIKALSSAVITPNSNEVNIPQPLPQSFLRTIGEIVFNRNSEEEAGKTNVEGVSMKIFMNSLGLPFQDFYHASILRRCLLRIPETSLNKEVVLAANRVCMSLIAQQVASHYMEYLLLEKIPEDELASVLTMTAPYFDFKNSREHISYIIDAILGIPKEQRNDVLKAANSQLKNVRNRDHARHIVQLASLLDQLDKGFNPPQDILSELSPRATKELFPELDKGFNPPQNSLFKLSPRATLELFKVAARDLDEKEVKDPRLLIAKALHQWSKTGADEWKLLIIANEGKEAVLSPAMALALLNGSKEITWDELTKEERTIECTLEGETEIASLFGADQKLLADNSNYFSTYFSGTMQALPLQDVSADAVLDLLRYLADPFLEFTDVNNAIDIIATADYFQAPTLVDRAVTWLNNHFSSLKTDEEREAFIQTLLEEDSLIRNLPVLKKIEAGDTYKEQVEERFKS